MPDWRDFRKLLYLCLLLVPAVPAIAQIDQFLPEVDFYYKLPPDSRRWMPDKRIWFQAKETRESGEPLSAEFGPSIDFLMKPWPSLSAISVFDIDQSKSRPIVVSFGYRYLPYTSGPSANRFEPIVTLNAPLRRVKVLLSDRNRFDFIWQGGGYSWRYRNRLQFQREFPLGRFHVAPFASAEFFYESQYSKWANTAIRAGCYFHFIEHLQLTPYYEHQNFTGKSPNQQYNQFGLMLNIFYARK